MKDDNNKVEISITTISKSAADGKGAKLGANFIEYEASENSTSHTDDWIERFIIGKAGKPFAVRFACLDGYEYNGFPEILVEVLISDSIYVSHTIKVDKTRSKKHIFTPKKTGLELRFDAKIFGDPGGLGSIVVMVRRMTPSKVEDRKLAYKFSYGSKATIDSLKQKPAAKPTSSLLKDNDADTPQPNPTTSPEASSKRITNGFRGWDLSAPHSQQPIPPRTVVTYAVSELGPEYPQDSFPSCSDPYDLYEFSNQAEAQGNFNKTYRSGLPSQKYTPILTADYDRDDEEVLVNMIRTENSSFISASSLSPSTSSNYTYATDIPVGKVDSPDADDLSEPCGFCGEGRNRARTSKNPLGDRARDLELANGERRLEKHYERKLAKKKRDLKKRYKLDRANLKVEYKFRMKEIKKKERSLQG